MDIWYGNRVAPVKLEIIIFNKCLGAGSRQYCQHTKSPLGITPLKEIWEAPPVKENLTSVGFCFRTGLVAQSVEHRKT